MSSQTLLSATAAGGFKPFVLHTVPCVDLSETVPGNHLT